MAIEIVSFPIQNGGSFQFAMLHYQRVDEVSYRWPSKRLRAGVLRRMHGGEAEEDFGEFDARKKGRSQPRWSKILTFGIQLNLWLIYG